MKTLNERQWEIFDQFLVNVADFDYPTWQEKKQLLKENLSQSGLLALEEIASWDWE